MLVLRDNGNTTEAARGRPWFSVLPKRPNKNQLNPVKVVLDSLDS